MMNDYSGDSAVITICQNSRAKTVTISAVNEIATNIIGFNELELIGRKLTEILPPRIKTLLDEYVEYDSEINDVGTVLSKVQSFSVIGKNDKEKAYRLKVVRTQSLGNSIYFLLILQDSLGARKNEALRKTIRENFRGHESLDIDTDLPDRESLIKDINIMKRYAGSNNIFSCFAVLQIDRYNELLTNNGNKTCNEIMKYIAKLARRSVRPDDVVGHAGDGRIGILLVDIAKGSERMVLNRLRWQVASNPYIGDEKETIGISITISFANISDDSNGNELIKKCEHSLDNLGDNAHNTLIESAA
ncbi:MAG: GGDEF domain-containing protein [Rickettsiales bacterium]